MYINIMKDTSIKDLLNELIRKLNLEYGSFEVKVHDGKWMNYSVTVRVNHNESESKDVLTKLRE